MRHLTAMTVCVNYSHLLDKSLDEWMRGVDRLVVVTSHKDADTHGACMRRDGICVHVTDVFYRDGAYFNKGRAMAEAFDAFIGTPEDWMLFFDADITPPPRWREHLNHTKLREDCLYGARRRDDRMRMINDPDIAGYFHLAHASDPNMTPRPIVDTHWTHAGNYDTTFQDRWPRERRRFLPMTVIHTGVPGKNWCGVGNDEAVQNLHSERRRLHGWRHEVIDEIRET